MNFDFEKYILNEHKRIVEKEKEYVYVEDHLKAIVEIVNYQSKNIEEQLQLINEHINNMKRIDSVRIREVISED